MKKLFDLVRGLEILQEVSDNNPLTTISRDMISDIWREIRDHDFPTQEALLLERIAYNVEHAILKKQSAWVGIEQVGRMLHGRSEIPSNPVTVIRSIYMNRFDNEAGVKLIDAYLTANGLGRLLIKKENLGGEWVQQIILTTKVGNIHLTSWDE